MAGQLLVTRGIYHIACRNLSFGVFDGDEGMIGIREKFGSTYLFTEYLWEQGPPYGTVRPSPREHVADLAPWVPLGETTGTVCDNCREPVTYDREYRLWRGCSCGDTMVARAVPNQQLYNALLPFISVEEKASWGRSREFFKRRYEHRLL